MHLARMQETLAFEQARAAVSLVLPSTTLREDDDCVHVLPCDGAANMHAPLIELMHQWTGLPVIQLNRKTWACCETDSTKADVPNYSSATILSLRTFFSPLLGDERAVISLSP